MQQNDDNNRDFIDKTNTPSEKKIENMKDWRNEHGHPSFEYLQSLAMDGSLDAQEKLRSIAEDLDVHYDPKTSTEELIGKIRSATRSNPNTTT